MDASDRRPEGGLQACRVPCQRAARSGEEPTIRESVAGLWRHIAESVLPAEATKNYGRQSTQIQTEAGVKAKRAEGDHQIIASA